MALVNAARDGDIEQVITLIATGQCEIWGTDSAGDTALALASKNGHCEIVKTLLATGESRPEHINNTGDTALTLAAKQGHVEVVRALLETSRDCANTPDSDWSHVDISNHGFMFNSMTTALAHALDANHREVAKLLKSHIAWHVFFNNNIELKSVVLRWQNATESPIEETNVQSEVSHVRRLWEITSPYLIYGGAYLSIFASGVVTLAILG